MDINDKNKRKSLNKKILIGVGVVIVLFIIIGVSTSKNDTTNKTDDTKTTTNTQKPDLAKEADAQLKKSLDVTSYTDSDAPSNFQPINGFSQSGAYGNVDVNYQEDCTKDEAKSLSKQIMGMVGPDIKDLTSITVKCTNGSVDFTLRSEVLTN